MDHKLQKNIRPIDFLPDKPYEAIQRVWSSMDIKYLFYVIPYWLYMAVSEAGAVYDDDADTRRALVTLYVDLLPFIEAMYLLNEIKYAQENGKNEDLINPFSLHLLGQNYRTTYLKKYEIFNPILVVKKFCKTYSLLYLRNELWNLFETVQSYKGPIKKVIFDCRTPEVYLYLLTLVEAAYLLTTKEVDSQ